MSLAEQIVLGKLDGAHGVGQYIRRLIGCGLGEVIIGVPTRKLVMGSERLVHSGDIFIVELVLWQDIKEMAI